jgi:hypothetical protein
MRVKITNIILTSLFCLGFTPVGMRLDQVSGNNSKNYDEAREIVQQMRGFSMQWPAMAPSNGRIDPIDKKELISI